MNSIKNMIKSSEVPSATKDLADRSLEIEKKGEDVKGAFLALLQGLVGFGGVTIPQAVPVAVKVAPLEQKAKTPQIENSASENGNREQADSNKKLAPEKNTSVKEEVTQQPTSPTEKVGLAQDKDKNVTEVKNVTSENAPKVVSTEKPGKDIQIGNENGIMKPVSVQTSPQQNISETIVKSEPTAKTSVATEANPKVVNDSNVIAASEEAVKEIPVQIKQEIKNIPVNNQAEQGLKQASTKSTLSAPEDANVALKVAEVKEDSIEKELVENTDQPDESLNEIRKFLSNNSDSTHTESPKITSAVEKSSEKMDSVKDALLARLLLGVEQSTIGSNNPQLTAGSKTDFQVISALGIKDSSGGKLGTEKTHASLLKSEVKAQEFVDKIKEILAKAAANKTNDSISVKVNPAHLGEIKVTVTHRNYEIHAKLVPESKEIEQILKTKTAELNAVIQALGFNAENVHVQIGNQPNTNFSWTNIFKGNQENASNNGSSKENRKSFSKNVDVAELVGGSVPESNVLQDSGWVA